MENKVIYIAWDSAEGRPIGAGEDYDKLLNLCFDYLVEYDNRYEIDYWSGVLERYQTTTEKLRAEATSDINHPLWSDQDIMIGEFPLIDERA